MGLTNKLQQLLTPEPSTLEEHFNKEQLKLYNHAKKVDSLDRYIGPTGSMMQIYGNEFWQGIGKAINIAEVLFLKVPFMYHYYKHTKDVSAFYWWIPKEMLATGTQIGGFIDIAHSYYETTKQRLEQEVIKEKKRV